MKFFLIQALSILFFSCTLVKAVELEVEKDFLIKVSHDPRVQVFLKLLAYGEGTLYHPEVKNLTDQYRISFCNEGKATSFKDHPRKKCCYPVGNRIICATAAGRYMFLQRTWDWVSDTMDLHDFSPVNQDLAALYLLVLCGALDEILKNNIEGAIRKASVYWAPMPGNSYNQPQKKLKELLDFYDKQLNLYKSFDIFYPHHNKQKIIVKKGKE